VRFAKGLSGQAAVLVELQLRGKVVLEYIQSAAAMLEGTEVLMVLPVFEGMQ
jgi:hypothetical protein